jgi:high affinity sulfate transporter 1
MTHVKNDRSDGQQAGKGPTKGGWSTYVPGIAMLRSYQTSRLRPDLVAGIVLAAILVPQGLAYAELAGLPPVTGLYTTVACLVAYALFGPSRVLVLGPDSSVSPLIFAAVIPLVAVGDSAAAVVLAGMLALLVGGIEIGLGVAKLGFVADLLSKEVQVGYMNGLAVTIFVGQLPKLFGFSTDASGFIDEVRAFVSGLGGTNVTTLVLGLATLGLLFLLPRLTTRIPAVLVAVVGATVATAALGLTEHGVKTVGTLPKGLPVPSFPWTGWGDLGTLTIAALGIVLVSLTDTIATSTSFAARRGDDVDPNQEMIGVGSANLAAGFFQGFAVSVSGSRTAVATQSGAKTQVTGLVGAGVVVALLVLLPSLFKNLPQTALAAVVIAAAFSLLDLRALVAFFTVRKASFVLSLTATVGVVLFGVLQGIIIAVVLSIFLFFQRSWWPPGEVLGYDERLDGWHDLKRHPGATQRPGIVVYRWEAPLFFANAGMFRQQVRRLVLKGRPGWVILQCEAVTDIDVTAADMLKRLDLELNAQGVHLAFVELRSRLRDLLVAYGLLEILDREHFYASMAVALESIHDDGGMPSP